jgi:hypothetical protein
MSTWPSVKACWLTYLAERARLSVSGWCRFCGGAASAAACAALTLHWMIGAAT